MKTIRLLSIGIMLILVSTAQSQLSVNVHIGTPPAWGPSGHSDVRYYYLPDVEAYYDVQTSMFIYISGNQWIRRSYLPARYRNYDLYHGHKVVMNDYRGNSPYTHFKEHKMKYAKGYRDSEQRNIGERDHGRNNNDGPQVRVYKNEKKNQHPAHNQEKRNSNDDRNNGHDNGKRK